MSKNKFMVIPGLQPGETYHYRIVVTDRAGNKAVSPEYLVLTPVQQPSVFDLIAAQFLRNFSFFGNL